MDKQRTDDSLTKFSTDTIKVDRDHVVEIIKVMERSRREDMQAFGYVETGNTVRTNELTFFESVADARQFASQKAHNDGYFQVVPLEAFEKMMKEKIFLTDKERSFPPVIELAVDEIEHIQQALNFNRSTKLMEQTMKEQHWKEMAPDHLISFLHDLKGMYDDSDAGKKVVVGLVKRYWPDILNEQKLLLNNSNNKIMNEKNFEYLKDNIKYLGFGEKQHDELEKNLKAGNDSFQMTYKAEINKKAFEAVLQFKKPENSELYFLNSYHATLERSNGEKMEQTFYLNKGQGVTAKEAYNLLEGRAVHKELTTKAGESYNAWIQLDFENKDKHNNNEVKQFHENYGYNLRETLSYYPVKEMMKEEEAKTLIRSLEKGNVQMVTLELPGKEMKIFMEANPQFKTLTLYDDKMKRLDQSQRQEIMIKPELKEGKDQGKNQKEEKGKKQELDKEDQPEKKQDKGRKKMNGHVAGEDSGLVTKKRTSNKKGLSL